MNALIPTVRLALQPVARNFGLLLAAVRRRG